MTLEGYAAKKAKIMQNKNIIIFQIRNWFWWWWQVYILTTINYFVHTNCNGRGWGWDTDERLISGSAYLCLLVLRFKIRMTVRSLDIEDTILKKLSRDYHPIRAFHVQGSSRWPTGNLINLIFIILTFRIFFQQSMMLVVVC